MNSRKATNKSLSVFLVIDAPASALNMGNDKLDNFKNSTAVKVIRTTSGQAFPYVAAQSYRHHLREAMAVTGSESGLNISDAYQDGGVAYSSGDPAQFFDDDLLGYMCAAPKKEKEVKSRKRGKGEAPVADANDGAEEDSKDVDARGEALTRRSALRTATLVSMAPVWLTRDFGTMTRHLDSPERDGTDEWHPIIHSHNFYSTLMSTAMSFVTTDVGVFKASDSSGSKNLKPDQLKALGEQGVLDVTYRTVRGKQVPEFGTLPLPERITRAQALMRALPRTEGGAKQATHYTDIRPRVMLICAAQGCPNVFQYVVKFDGDRLLISETALRQALRVHGSTSAAPLGIGWVAGFHDEALATLIRITEEMGVPYVHDHPLLVADYFAQHMADHPAVYFE